MSNVPNMSDQPDDDWIQRWNSALLNATPPKKKPQGFLAIMAYVLLAIVMLATLASIWLTEWRWAATAVVLLTADFFLLGASMKEVKR